MARASTAGVSIIRSRMSFHHQGTQRAFESQSEEEKNKEIEDAFNEILDKARQGEGHELVRTVSRYALFWGPSEEKFLELAVVEGTLDTVLHIAAAKGDTDSIFHICNGFNDRGTCWPFGRTRPFILHQNTNGDTPLHCAAAAGRMDAAVSLLAEWIIPWQYDNLKDEYEEWPPDLVEEQYSTLARELLDMRNTSGKTAAEEAEAAGNSDVAFWLAHLIPKGEAEVAFKSLPIAEADKMMHDFCNEIITTTRQSNCQLLVEMIKLRSLDWGILPQKFLDTAVVDGTGDTCLHIAASSGDLDMIQTIVNKIDYVGCARNHRGAHLLTGKQNANGDTPLHCAARMGYMDAVVHLFLNWSFPCTMKYLKGRYNMWPPEMGRGHISPEDKELDLQLLNMRNNAGRTAVEESVAAGRMDIAYWLVHMVSKPEHDRT